jgi:sugar phosphate isomerase/epimerase
MLALGQRKCDGLHLNRVARSLFRSNRRISLASQIAAQLYTLREYCKTPADIAQALKKVKQIGYDAVQVSGIGKIDPKELAGILKGEGLACCVTHISMERMRDEPQQVAEEHKMWGCEYTAIGGYGFKGDATSQTWADFAKDYSAIAANLAKLGLLVGYHNHSHELVKYDGQTALDTLIQKTDKSVWFEIDTYWITHGGGDPVQWINKVAGRIPCIHLKDMAIRPDRTQIMAEVGEGNLNFPGIIEAAKKAGTKWFIVEQDNCNGKDPFECLSTSLRNLKKLGLN